MIKIIIFDFDGVILDNYELHYSFIQKQITNITREEHRRLFDGNINVEREKLSHRNTGYDLKKHFSDAKLDMVIDSEVKKTLKYLSEKYILGIITSAREYGVKGCLEYNRLSKYFSFIYGYETSTLKKDKFKKVFTEYVVSPDECIFVADTVGDILEAHEAGVETIAVDFGYHDRERIIKVNPLAIASNFSELSQIVSKIRV